MVPFPVLMVPVYSLFRNLGWIGTFRPLWVPAWFGSAMTFKRSSLSSHAYGPLFGAGYAAGALMRLDATGFQVLLNYLAQEASGLTTWRLDKRHTLKSYVFAGMPASNGVKAAALVRSGFTGDGDVLDPSNRNMLDAICPAPRPADSSDGNDRTSVCASFLR